MHARIGLLALTFAACGDSTHQPPDAAPGIDAAIDTPGQTVDDFTAEEAALLATLSPLPAVPADRTNAFADSVAAAQLGQMLFFDKSYAGPLTVGDDATNHGLGQAGETGKVACASCHAAGSATLDDQRSLPNNVSLGIAFGTRNAHGLVNSSYYAWSNWGGRFDSQWSLPLAVSEGGATMKSTRLQIAHLLYDRYRAEYDAIFPVPLDPALDPTAGDAARFPPSGKPKPTPADPDGAWEGMAPADRDIVNRIFANYGKALAAYNRKLVSGNAPFDRYVAGDRTAISEAAKRGLHGFLAACAGCHAGPSFADDQFHSLALAQSGPNVPQMDLGRYQDVPPLLASAFNTDGVFSDDRTTGKLTGLVQDDAQKGTFRTKGLRGVAQSAPYMHAGQLATLADVVALYSAGSGEAPALNLTAAQQADLVAFLQTLTGEPVPTAWLVDTSK